MKNIILISACIILFLEGWCQEAVFDNHVHIWEGEKSVQKYIKELDSTGQTVTKFGAIHMAQKGKLEPVLPGCSLAKKVIWLFECLPKDDLEHRMHRGLRPHAFEKGTEQRCLSLNH